MVPPSRVRNPIDYFVTQPTISAGEVKLPTILPSFLDQTSVVILQIDSAIAVPTCDLQVIKHVDVRFLLRLLT